MFFPACAQLDYTPGLQNLLDYTPSTYIQKSITYRQHGLLKKNTEVLLHRIAISYTASYAKTNPKMISDSRLFYTMILSFI
jgi:hypothetical protein